MKKKRILILMHKDLVPPEKATKKELEFAEWKTEYYVSSTLKSLGHEVLNLGVISDLRKISKAIEDFDPHVAFNLLEEFDGEATFDQHVVSYLELKHQAYTGCSPRGLVLARDKALSKKILHYHRIPVPKFQVFPKNRRIKRRSSLKFPLIVKSLTEEASFGISQASVVTNDEKLAERIEFIHESIKTDAICEEFIEGREIYIGLLGNKRFQVFHPWELVFKSKTEGSNYLATSQVKHNPKYRKRHNITTADIKDLSGSELDKLATICKRVARALDQYGYSRIDLRLTAEGIPYVLEANPNPDIADYEDFAMGAYTSGIEYPDLLERIVGLGIRRHGETWRH
jgi:D-alanine-D-alanine ligase